MGVVISFGTLVGCFFIFFPGSRMLATISWRLLLGSRMLATMSWRLLLGSRMLATISWRLLLGSRMLATISWRLLLGSRMLATMSWRLLLGSRMLAIISRGALDAWCFRHWTTDHAPSTVQHDVWCCISLGNDGPTVMYDHKSRAAVPPDWPRAPVK